MNDTELRLLSDIQKLLLLASNKAIELAHIWAKSGVEYKERSLVQILNIASDCKGHQNLLNCHGFKMLEDDDT